MFAGGLGMFLFGVHSTSGGAQKCAGEQMRKPLGILTNNRFCGRSGGSTDHSCNPEQRKLPQL